jgi:hypothetical protein
MPGMAEKKRVIMLEKSYSRGGSFRGRRSICIIKSLPWWQCQRFGCSCRTLKCCVCGPPIPAPVYSLHISEDWAFLHRTWKPDLPPTAAPQNSAAATAYQPFLPGPAVPSLPHPVMWNGVHSLSCLGWLSTFRHTPLYVPSLPTEAFKRDALFSSALGSNAFIGIQQTGHSSPSQTVVRVTCLQTQFQPQLQSGHRQSLLDRKAVQMIDLEMIATTMQRKSRMIK